MIGKGNKENKKNRSFQMIAESFTNNQTKNNICYLKLFFLNYFSKIAFMNIRNNKDDR